MNHWVNMEHWCDDTERGKLKYSEEKLSHPHFVHTWPGLGLNPVLRGEKQATTNRRPRHGPFCIWLSV